ncbi:MAG: hypothetical protein WBC53_02745 [Phycisphaerae bacterium]
MADRKKPGCLAKLLALFLLGGLAVWGIKSCGDHVFAPETPEQAEKRKQEEATQAEKRQQEDAVKAEKWKQEEVKQPGRRELIQKLIGQGVFQKVEFRAQGATVWVGPTFYLLDFEAKQEFCSVVYAYVATNAKDDLVSVTLKDVQSGKTVGDYGQQWTGFGLKMK